MQGGPTTPGPASKLCCVWLVRGFPASRTAGTATVVLRFRGDAARGGPCIDVDQCQRCRVAVLCMHWSTSMGSGLVECVESAVEVGRYACRRGGGVGGAPPKGSESTLTNASANMSDDNVDSGQRRCHGPPRGANV